MSRWVQILSKFRAYENRWSQHRSDWRFLGTVHRSNVFGDGDEDEVCAYWVNQLKSLWNALTRMAYASMRLTNFVFFSIPIPTFTSISVRSTSSASRCLTDDDEEERGNNFIHLVLIEMNYVYSVRSFIIFGSLCVCERAARVYFEILIIGFRALR